MKSKFKCVIFDLDGTLLDTESIYYDNWIKAFKHFGYHLTHEQALQMRSLGRPHSFKLVKKWFGKHTDVEEIRTYRRIAMAKYFKTHPIKLKKNAKQILSWLKENKIPVAIATSNNYVKTQGLLKKTGLTKYIDKIVAADNVKRGKPSPDIYKFACKSLKLKPKQCIAVEDCPNGVISACKAHCYTVMVPDLTQPSQDKVLSKYKFEVIDNLLDLKKIIKK